MTVVSNGGLWNSGTYIPYKCNITAITQAANAVITTNVNHGWVVGNLVTFNIPAIYGMSQISGVTGLVLATTADTITTNIDTSNFDAFSIPTVSSLTVLDNPEVLPAGGENTGYVSADESKPALQIPGTFRNTYP